MTKPERDNSWRALAGASDRRKYICVYLASSTGRNSRFAAEARTLGRLMAEAGIGLVYGGARVGLMGVLADTVLDHGGAVAGFLPRRLQDKEVAHEGLTRLHVVDTMHERKRGMQQLASACIAMPGGFGTLEEIFEALSWTQLGLCDKPCVFLNVDGFYDDLFRFLDHAVAAGLLREQHRPLARQAQTAERALRIVREAWAAKGELLPTCPA